MATRNLTLEQELRRIDHELNGPRIVPEQDSGPPPKPKKKKPQPWAAEQLLPDD